MQLSDREFINQFEDQTLDPVHFNHIGHLRLCWLNLQQYDLETAIEKTCKGIALYAESQGAHEKFHRTITEFLTWIPPNCQLLEGNRSIAFLHPAFR